MLSITRGCTLWRIGKTNHAGEAAETMLGRMMVEHACMRPQSVSHRCSGTICLWERRSSSLETDRDYAWLNELFEPV